MKASHLLATVLAVSIATCLASECDHPHEQSCFELSKNKFTSKDAWEACEGGRLADASRVEVTNIITDILKSKNVEAVWVKGSSAFSVFQENNCPVRLNKDGESELLFNEEFENSCEDKYKLKAVCEFDVTKVRVKKCEVDDSLIRYGYLVPCTKKKRVEPGTTLRVECWTGYSLKGPEEITCQENGKWSKWPICEPVCAASLLQGDGITVYPLVEKTKVGEQIQYYKLNETAMIVCENGFLADSHFPAAHKIVTCLGSNRWSHVFPHCIPFHKISSSHALRARLLLLQKPDHTSVTLDCYPEDYNGIPKIWSKNQQEISMGDKYSVDELGTLTIKDFTHGDEGHYVCTIQASPSDFEFLSFDLRVQTNDFYLQPKEKEMIKLKEGESKILICKNSEYFSRLKWYKNGVPYFGTSTGSTIRDDGALYLNTVSYKDNGLYICTDERPAVVTISAYQVKVAPKGTNVCGQFFYTAQSTGVVDNKEEGEEAEEEEIASIHEHTPWLVSFHKVNENTLFSYGTLISERWIIASARVFRIMKPTVRDLVARVGMDHVDKTDDAYGKIRENEDIDVLFKNPQEFTTSTRYIDDRKRFHILYDLQGLNGALKLTDEVDVQELHDYEIEDIIIHPDHDGRMNNLALIYLKNEVPVTNIVRPICLPNILKFSDDSNCEEARIRNGTFRTRGIIHDYATLPSFTRVNRLTQMKPVDIYPHQECEEVFKRKLPPNIICTQDRFDYGDDKNLFKPDSGSPLEVAWLNRYILWGVFAERPQRYYNTFTKVLPYLDWIKDEMEKKANKSESK